MALAKVVRSGLPVGEKATVMMSGPTIDSLWLLPGGRHPDADRVCPNEPETMLLPSGEKATDMTKSVWPSIGSPMLCQCRHPDAGSSCPTSLETILLRRAKKKQT